MSSILVTFSWWERLRGNDQVEWQFRKVVRHVPRRKSRAAQSRVVRKRFLELIAKRVAATTDAERQFAYWNYFHPFGTMLHDPYGVEIK